MIRGEADALAVCVPRLFILPLRCVRIAQIKMCSVFSRVGLDFLLIGLCRFVQFPGYVRIVVSSDVQLFPFGGMLAQLKCLGEVFAAPPYLTKV
jgi:hypothetical protein